MPAKEEAMYDQVCNKLNTVAEGHCNHVLATMQQHVSASTVTGLKRPRHAACGPAAPGDPEPPTPPIKSIPGQGKPGPSSSFLYEHPERAAVTCPPDHASSGARSLRSLPPRFTEDLSTLSQPAVAGAAQQSGKGTAAPCSSTAPAQASMVPKQRLKQLRLAHPNIAAPADMSQQNSPSSMVQQQAAPPGQAAPPPKQPSAAEPRQQEPQQQACKQQEVPHPAHTIPSASYIHDLVTKAVAAATRPLQQQLAHLGQGQALLIQQQQLTEQAHQQVLRDLHAKHQQDLKHQQQAHQQQLQRLQQHLAAAQQQAAHAEARCVARVLNSQRKAWQLLQPLPTGTGEVPAQFPETAAALLEGSRAEELDALLEAYGLQGEVTSTGKRRCLAKFIGVDP